MRSHRQPKGAYVRSTPDWLSDKLACLSVANWQQPIGGDNQTWLVELFNNDIIGRNFLVYSLVIGSDSAAPTLFDFFRGHTANLVSTAFALGSALATPPGLGYSQAFNTPQPNTTTPISNPIGGLTNTAFGEVMTSHHPLFVIQPGQSLRFCTTQNSFELSVTIWYVYHEHLF